MIVGILSLAISAILSFSVEETDNYRLEIEERGTTFIEEVEIDVKRNVQIFRVPAHNNVSGAVFYHDFDTRVSVSKIPSQKVCYISTMDPSLSSPAKLKADIKRATSQSGKLPIETESYAVIVTGHADRSLLDQGILNFCGALPIYNTELAGTKPSTDGAAIIRGRARRVRQKRTNTIIVKEFKRSCKQMANTYTQPNGTTGYDFSHVESCMNGKPWDLSCRMKDGLCFYFVTCKKQTTVLDWLCKEVHKASAIPACCDFICPS